MPKKPRILPHPSTLVEMNPEDDILFRERYRTLKTIVYELEDENNIIAFKSAQAKARIAELRAELRAEGIRRQDPSRRVQPDVPGAEASSSSRHHTTTPPFSPPRTSHYSHSHTDSQSSQHPPTSHLSQPQPSGADPQRASTTPTPNLPAAAPASGQSNGHTRGTGPKNGQKPGGAHVRGQGSNASATTGDAATPTTSTAGGRRTPLVGPNGEEDELMSD